MTDQEAERLLAACRLLGDHPEERRLLMSEVADVKLVNRGTSDLYEVVFADDSRASFKPIEGVEQTANAWGHTAVSVILNDYAAWLVARGIGYAPLVGGVVLTTCAKPGVGFGSMQSWLEGALSGHGGHGWEQARHIREAALFDAITGQQDRSITNFVYDESSDALGFFDHSFTFALPKQRHERSVVLDEVHCQGGAELDQTLIDALDRFDVSAECAALQYVLAPDRYARVVERVSLMRSRAALLRGGEY